MTTLNEASYNILNILRGGRSFDNDPFSIEQIKYTIGYYRALLVRRDLEREGRTEELEQDLGFVSLEVVDPTEGTMFGMDNLVLRTSGDIPEPVRLKDRIGITAVYAPDRAVAYPVIDYRMNRFQKYNKYTDKVARSFYLNKKVHIIGTSLMTNLSDLILATKTLDEIPLEELTTQPMFCVVRGIFENPVAAWEFAHPDEEWSDDTSPYPLPSDMEQRIAQSLISGEFKVLSQTPIDKVADGLPDAQ